MQLVSRNRAWARGALFSWTVLIAGLGLLAPTPGLRAQVSYLETNVTVSTIGGGPLVICGPFAGHTDGSTYSESQFNGPVSIALDSKGNLFVADRTNNTIRMVTQIGNNNASQTTTLLTNTAPTVTNSPFLVLTNAAPYSKSQIVAVAVDAGDNLYVLLQGDNALVKYNTYLNALFAYPLPYSPTAMALSQGVDTNIYITFTNGLVLELAQNGDNITGTNILVTNGAVKWQPDGIAWRTDGLLAVSDLNKNIIYTISGTNHSPYVPAQGATNWVDGNPRYAAFNQPAGLAWTADGQLIVADRGNNALRRIDTDGTVSTIYGVNSKLWTATTCSSEVYAGWVDGAPGPYGTNASGRGPVSLVIAPGGNIYVSELYYDLLREVQGVGLQPQTVTNSGGGTGTNTNVVVPPPPAPVFAPNFGYYPECQTITVTSTVPTVYYTIDGTAPSTNGLVVENMTNNSLANAYVGSFLWCNSALDLSSLQMIAVNTNASPFLISAAAAGRTSPVNQIGFPSGKLAGVGSTAVIPLVVNLQAGQSLKSLQFRVEINPIPPATAAIPSLTLLPISTNDFLPLLGPAPGNAPVDFETFAYTPASTNGQGLVVSAAGDNSGLAIQNFAAVALLEVPVPATAQPGQSYQLTVLYPSGTSDGAQDEVTMTPMMDQTLTVSNLTYFAGDSSPSGGYNAGEFGDGVLNNSDVNNALMASVGIHVPFPFTDAYNAMDVYPETPGPDGEIGDGFITYLDWQLILRHSLGLDPNNNYVRFWTPDGVLSHYQTNWAPGPADVIPIGVPAPSRASAAGVVSKALAGAPLSRAWFREATMSAGTVANLLPGGAASIPVSLNVLPGCSLAGFQFRAMLCPVSGAPVAAPLQFAPAAGIPAPWEFNGLSSNEIVCAWPLAAFSPPLQGSNLLGSVTFRVPSSAAKGQSYTLRFTGVDGAPDLNTPYQLESVPGSAWVSSAALAPPQITSDEWRIYYFGSVTNPMAADNADPDGDGIPNWEEYLAGTNPTNALSRFQFSGAGFGSGGPQNINLSWLTAPGKYYVLESAPALWETNWTPLSTNIGDGSLLQIPLTNPVDGARFYRIQIIQP